MGLRAAWQALLEPRPVIVERGAPAAQVAEARKGYDIPYVGASPLLAGGSTTARSLDPATWQDRQRTLPLLYGAYVGCSWVSTCVDRIARSATAGGAQVAAVEPGPDGDPAEPAALAPVRALLGFANESDEPLDLLSGWVAAASIFGVGYLEVVSIGGTPAALYPLNSSTIRIDVDEHGEEASYTQVTQDGRPNVVFEPDEIVKLSLRDPGGSPYGLGPVEKHLDPITRWLYYAGWEQANVRAGMPPDVHADLGTMPEVERRRWRERDRTDRRGIRNIGEPIVTYGGGVVTALPRPTLDQALAGKQVARDEIVSGFGVPPAKVGIIESGNLGGGTGESQDRTFRVDVVEPVARLAAERLTYRLVRQGAGITDWQVQFGQVDLRDSKVVEEVKDLRLRAGRDTLNEQRAAEDKPPVEGGDTPIFSGTGKEPVAWDHMGERGKPQPPPPMAPGQEPTSPDDPAKDPDDDGQEAARPVPAGLLAEEAAARQGGGVMVALYPPPLVARGLAVPGGEPPEALHVTLAYLGDAGQLNSEPGGARSRLREVVVGFAATAAPIRGEVSGVGRFTAGDEPVTYASVDAPALPSVRQRLVDALDRAGFPVSREHGFTPHITLAYADLDVGVPAGEVTFNALSLVVGDDREDFDLTGLASESERRTGVPDQARRPLEASWRKAYEQRRRALLKQLPKEPA